MYFYLCKKVAIVTGALQSLSRAIIALSWTRCKLNANYTEYLISISADIPTDITIRNRALAV